MTKPVTMRDVVAGVAIVPGQELAPIAAAAALDPREMSPDQVEAYGAELRELVPAPAAAACRVCGAIAMLDSAGLCGTSCNVVAECLRHIGHGRRVRAYMLARQLRIIELDYPHVLRITHRKDDRGIPSVYFFAACTRQGLEVFR